MDTYNPSVFSVCVWGEIDSALKSLAQELVVVVVLNVPGQDLVLIQRLDPIHLHWHSPNSTVNSRLRERVGVWEDKERTQEMKEETELVEEKESRKGRDNNFEWMQLNGFQFVYRQ